MEPVMNAVLLYQNYHLVHHLHPLIPFYRYVSAWRRNEEDYLAHDPALTTIAGRELTAEEYRRRRGLAAD
jgi:ring-1,2-phenylacetyl-CoA epoxidase subunit PaaE